MRSFPADISDSLFAEYMNETIMNKEIFLSDTFVELFVTKMITNFCKNIIILCISHDRKEFISNTYYFRSILLYLFTLFIISFIGYYLI